jgi:exonuclease III
MKRKIIFTKIKKDNIDIACLQETYLTNDVVDEIRKEWRGELYFITGTDRSGGLLTLIKSSNKIKNSSLIAAKDRILTVKIETDFASYAIINCYAPNNAHSQLDFFLTRLVLK